jgi:hypothetical protein
MKTTPRTAFKIIAAVASTLISIACADAPGGGGTSIALDPVFSDDDLAARFGSYYEPVEVKVEPAVAPYPLPLSDANVQNWGDVTTKVWSARDSKDKLLANGFVTTGWGMNDDVVAAYKSVKNMEVPVFVTTDSVLHLYHIQFDETLREIEEKEFYPDLTKFSRVFQAESQERYDATRGIENEAWKKGLAYFTVGLKLLDPDAKIPSAVKGLVAEELENIEAHQGFKSSAIFSYREDYSQYVPRGHYTRSQELKRYFKAMMWYGRMTMLIKGHQDHGPQAHQPALVSPEEAQAQSMLGCAIAGLLGELEVDDRLASKVWERMYTVTAYYVGLADDLTPQEYRKALRSVFGHSFKPQDLAGKDSFAELKLELAKLRPPAIYSGTGESVVNLDIEEGHKPTPEQLDRLLGKTQGFRIMGQRYVPDSYMLGQMVAPAVGDGGRAGAFTTVMIPDHGPLRGFPRGLDVMAILGSDRALGILQDLGDTDNERYDEQMAKLRKQFGEIPRTDWNRNLYWSWLYALSGLIEATEGAGWPTFMTTNAWADKQLNAALGSWSSLRHDTILYAKQSYTPTFTRESAEPRPPQPKPVVGYVEPVPEFYARLVALTNMTVEGLGAMEVLDDHAMDRLRSLGGILGRLQAISDKELANQELVEDDYVFIRNFGESLNAVVTGADADGQKTTLIADVHTDQNTRQVLEEGTGYLRLMLVAYKLPQGHVLIGAGPVFSYYEFKHPMEDRLSDEKWRELLQSDKPPDLPEWTRSFADF